MNAGYFLSAASLSVLLITAAAPASAADDKLEQLKEQGFARIAIANEPPFTAVGADGKVSGAAPDVARAIFEKLGVKEVVASISEYGAMIPGLQAGRHDAITAGLFMKPERCAAVAYSEPILCDAEAFALKKGNPLKLTSYKDIADNPDAKIGAPGGGTEEKLALEAGVPRDRVIVVPDGQSGIKMLQDGRIDVYSLPVLSIHDLMAKANDPNLETVAPVVNAPVYCDGAAFRKQDVALRDAFDVELKKLKESGEFAKIIEPYGFSAKAAMSTSREKLCAAAK
ncbi:ectoine/hydroxyectoine ABC transporter substrate-binding protein EhuB (plasmid) [Rhizobium ruizarguesonis]|jgi:polar amino acid transport system substrate-binding protein|uniref:Ectoine/hydroxyectoine ABC transporter substrate-binding protein EhuB n=1 Tax=Rhizobium ruizarguesonis TaxID=2081791 RepID=A0AAE5C267_9HYPH|nr:ectoine/hydroxyectoine ABC transporter substrate-binding protein EhuB [Rhizobium ruizarguesonis]MBY5850762.1 ectoine/hydroxyectoine ABC transporter substrate-binding protein EhuB [Rhizobium leguminosarum]NKJ70825.1 ectoine/hydroxyectoine ABC transporter substrate-binding protein EhuB [Rhizobium leguminosarum bv. viciae]QIO47399.1 ectoine/hydroxyectoine ABC transporter substrate-binding protein EhuB [Rhizobium leguminosarum bv. trifolii]MCB2402788.1 ectoine/hydroxyectoine ABC transporter subs